VTDKPLNSNVYRSTRWVLLTRSCCKSKRGLYLWLSLL